MSKVRVQKQKTLACPQNQWFYLDDLRAKLLLIIACIVCYGNTVFNEYSLDDDLAIINNGYIQKGISGIPDILTNPYVSTQNKVMDYRPIPGITFALERQFFGANPHVGHAVNILLFACCVLLIFKVLKDVFALQRIHAVLPFIICLFYAVHPVHTEVVASLKSRDEILSLIFVLLAFLCTHRFFVSPTKQPLYFIGAFAFFFLSYISKMVSMPMVVILIFTGIYFGFHKQKLKFYSFFSLLLSASIAYVAVIVANLQRRDFFIENPLNLNTDFAIRVGTAFKTLFFYFKFMFVPFPFRFYYGYNTIPLASISDSAAMFPFILHTFLFAYACWLFSRKDILGLIIISYFLSIVLFSNYFGNYPGIVAERVLFSPSIWFIAAFFIALFKIVGLDKLKNPAVAFPKSFALFICLALAGYTWLTIQRNFQWKDLITLMSSDIKYLSNSTLANYFYASALEEEAHHSTSEDGWRYYLTKAKEHYRQSVSVSPAYPEPYFKLGMILAYDEQQYDSAYEYFSKAYSLADTPTTPMQFQLAKSYYMKSENKRADTLFADLYNKLPEDTFTLFFYCRVRYALGDTLNALAINDQLIKLAPYDYYGYWNKALFLQETGRFPEAVEFFEKAIQYGYRDGGTINMLIDYYNSTGQSNKIAAINAIVNQ